MNGRAALVSAGGLWCALMLLACGGCSDQDAPAVPGAAACVVQGRLGVIGTDVTARVEFRGVATGAHERQFTVPADPSGWYRAELPAGDYVIVAWLGGRGYFYAADGIASREADADTVRLAPETSPRTADFPFGSLRFQAELPDALDGARFELSVYLVQPPSTASSFSRQFDQTVAGGHLDLTVPGLLPGSYRALCVWSRDWHHWGDHFWLPAERDPDQAALHRVGPDSVTTVPIGLATEPARLSGRVSGAWQAMGLEPPVVYVVSPEGDEVAGPWDVDGDGSFALDLYVPGPVKLNAVVEGIRQWVGGSRLVEATVFTPQAGQAIDGIEMIGSGLRLRVPPGAPVNSEDVARFEFYDPTGPTLLFTMTSRLQYQIGFANLPAGEWLVRVAPSWGSRPWRAQWLDRAATAAEADVLTLPGNGGILALDLVLELGGVISGHLSVASGDTQWVEIVATRADSRTNAASDAVLGPEAEFALVGLPDGAYRIGVVPPHDWWGGAGAAPPDSTFWYPGTTDWAAAQILMISDAGTVEDLLLTAP